MYLVQDIFTRTSMRTCTPSATGALFGVALFLMSSCLKVTAGDDDLRETWQLWSPAVLLGLILFALDEALRSRVDQSLGSESGSSNVDHLIYNNQVKDDGVLGDAK